LVTLFFLEVGFLCLGFDMKSVRGFWQTIQNHSFDGVGGAKPLPWEYIYGTGKWKGVKGGGTVKAITRGKPIAEGTFQMCIEVSGTYELPQ